MFAKYEDLYAFEGDFMQIFTHRLSIRIDELISSSFLHSFSRFRHRKRTNDDEIMSSPILDILMMGIWDEVKKCSKLSKLTIYQLLKLKKNWRKLTRIDKKNQDVWDVLGNDSWYGDFFSFKPVAYSFLSLEWSHSISHEA